MKSYGFVFLDVCTSTQMRHHHVSILTIDFRGELGSLFYIERHGGIWSYNFLFGNLFRRMGHAIKRRLGWNDDEDEIN